MKKILLTLTFLMTTSLLSSSIKPIPLNVSYDHDIAMLGKALFFEPKLSKDGTLSCASCHHLPGSGADGVAYSFGIGGIEGNINSPTVLNSRYNFVQFWDGRVKSLEEQALLPIINPIEMGNSLKNVLKTLEEDEKYKKWFLKLFDTGVTEENLALAIAEFERALITPNAPYDRFLRGDEEAISSEVKEGYTLFESYGCISCHNGVNIGSNLYQKIGVFKPFNTIKYDKHLKKGHFMVSGDAEDLYYFKVPTLRNIELTAPYMHSGYAKTLESAVSLMFEHQLGIEPQKKEIDLIVHFLKSLTGDMPAILDEK
jgi:cytochrome c peroxidase